MVIQPGLLVEQTDHRTDHAQLTAAATTRRDPTQQGTGLLVSPQQQPSCETCDDQQRYGKQGKYQRSHLPWASRLRLIVIHSGCGFPAQ